MHGDALFHFASTNCSIIRAKVSLARVDKQVELHQTIEGIHQHDEDTDKSPTSIVLLLLGKQHHFGWIGLL